MVKSYYFLRQLYNTKWSNTHDYIQLGVEHHCSNGALPFINGMVSDVNKVWSDSTWLPYNTWKSKYNEAVDIIMNKRY